MPEHPGALRFLTIRECSLLRRQGLQNGEKGLSHLHDRGHMLFGRTHPALKLPGTILWVGGFRFWPAVWLVVSGLYSPRVCGAFLALSLWDCGLAPEGAADLCDWHRRTSPRSPGDCPYHGCAHVGDPDRYRLSHRTIAGRWRCNPVRRQSRCEASHRCDRGFPLWLQTANCKLPTPHRIFFPNAELASSTARSAVRLRSSITGLTSTTSKLSMRPWSARISIAKCASR